MQGVPFLNLRRLEVTATGLAALFAAGCDGGNELGLPLDVNMTAEEVYRRGCAECHGTNGQGDDPGLIPAIAGLPDYYVVGELEKFRDLLRGEEADRPDGVLVMHRVAGSMDEKLMRGTGEVIARMPPVVSAVTVAESGDIERGKALYAGRCAECHGMNAEGDPGKESPPLYVFQDWYLARQIEKFRAGEREADPLHLESVKMHGMAKAFQTEEEILDVAAFIKSRLAGVSDAEP